MKIDKNNYEAYILDYLEGALSEREREAVELFAYSHPELAIDLKEELPQLYSDEKTMGVDSLKKNLVWKEEEVSHLIIEFLEARIDGLELSFAAENRLTQWRDSFSEKYDVLFAALKKTYIQPNSQSDESLRAGLTSLPKDHDDFEIIAFLEGDLSALEHTAFKKAALSDSEKHLSIDNYKKTFLLPVIEELPSSFKNDLKQKQSSIIPIWLYRSMAAAAVVLFGFFFFNKLETIESNQTTDFSPRTQTTEEQLLEEVDETDNLTFRIIESEVDESNFIANTSIVEDPSNFHKTPASNPLFNEAVLTNMNKSYALLSSSSYQSNPINLAGDYLLEADHSQLAIHKAFDSDVLLDEQIAEENSAISPLELLRDAVLKRTGQDDEQSLAMSLVNKTAKKLSNEKEDFIVYEKSDEGKNGFKFKLGKFSVETIR